MTVLFAVFFWTTNQEPRIHDGFRPFFDSCQDIKSDGLKTPHRPNRASWYAVTWQSLDRLPGYDAGAAETFRRGAYRQFGPLKNASRRPSHGLEAAAIAPSRGAIKPVLDARSTPSHGNHLDMPSAAIASALTQCVTCRPTRRRQGSRGAGSTPSLRRWMARG